MSIDRIERAKRAYDALDEYAAGGGSDFDDLRGQIKELLHDLRHLCDQEYYDFEILYSLALADYFKAVRPAGAAMTMEPPPY